MKKKLNDPPQTIWKFYYYRGISKCFGSTDDLKKIHSTPFYKRALGFINEGLKNGGEIFFILLSCWRVVVGNKKGNWGTGYIADCW